MKKQKKKKTSAAQIAASLRYNEKNTIQVAFRLNKTHDADIIEKLANVENKQGYIKGLIREDLKG